MKSYVKHIDCCNVKTSISSKLLKCNLPASITVRMETICRTVCRPISNIVYHSPMRNICGSSNCCKTDSLTTPAPIANTHKTKIRMKSSKTLPEARCAKSTCRKASTAPRKVCCRKAAYQSPAKDNLDKPRRCSARVETKPPETDEKNCQCGCYDSRLGHERRFETVLHNHGSVVGPMVDKMRNDVSLGNSASARNNSSPTGVRKECGCQKCHRVK